MLRKIISAILLAILVSTQMQLQTFATTPNTKYIEAKGVLEQSSYKKYIPKLELIVAKMSDSELDTLLTRVQALNVSEDNTVLDLLTYIEALIRLEQEARNQQEIADLTEIQIEKNERALIEKDILHMQELFAGEIKDLLENSIAYWEKTSSYEEEGDFSLDVDIDMNDTLDATFDLDIADYTARASKFDQEFEGKINAIWDAKSSEKESKGEFSSLAQLIFTDGNYFFLLDKLKLILAQEDKTEEIQSIVAKLQKLAKEKTYIQFGDESSKAAIEMLQKIRTDNISDQVDEYFSKALLEAYKVEEDTYYLRPTKLACDTIKSTMAVFDPFSGSSCSQGQYEDMLQEFALSGAELTLIKGSSNTTQLSIENSDVVGSMNLKWDNNSIQTFTGSFEDADLSGLNTLSWEYNNGENILVNANLKEIGLRTSLDIELSLRNEIKDIDFAYLLDMFFITIDISASYRNNHFKSLLYVDMQGKEYLNCNLDGVIRSEFTELGGECTISLPSYNFETGEQETNTIEAEYMTQYDTRGSNNNLNFKLNIQVENEGTIKIKAKNTGTHREKSNINISAPNKFIDYKNLELEENIEGLLIQ